jgi:hypothetical protein
MNRTTLSDQVYTALNQELIRRLLIRYFSQKGFRENFNKRVYPPLIQDITVLVPQMSGRVEVVPYVEDINPENGIVRLHWNLFVEGNKRLFLGESVHTSLADVRNAVFGPPPNTRFVNYATPKRIVNFIVRILGDSKNGDIAMRPDHVYTSALPLGTGEHSGYFRTQQRPVL